jgi:hypothetical protein
MILQEILKSPNDCAGLITDAQVAQNTHIALEDVRSWFAILDDDGMVELAATLDGLSAAITPKGRLAIRSALAIGPPAQNEQGSNGFLAPFVRRDSLIVLGRFLEPFRRFEASGLTAFGDAMASVELRGALEVLGAKSVRVAWASRLQGERLSDNLIMLGGPDNNAISKRFLSLVNPTFRSGLDAPNEIAVRDSIRERRYTPDIDPSDEGISTDYGIIISRENPFSSNKSAALYIAGSFGYGTWAGAKFVTSEEFLNNNDVKSGSPFECLVETTVFMDSPQSSKLIDLRLLK